MRHEWSISVFWKNARFALSVAIGIFSAYALALPFLGLGCAGGKAYHNRPLFKPDESNTFLTSLGHYSTSNWTEATVRARYDAIYYIMEGRAKLNGETSKEHYLFEKLKNLDVSDAEDSAEVEALSRIVLRDLDLDVTTPGNEFLDQELTKRVEWAVHNSAWHPGFKDIRFDELGKDVIMLGVPEIMHLSFMPSRYMHIDIFRNVIRKPESKFNEYDTAMLVMFPNAGRIERHYEFSPLKGYESIPTPLQFQQSLSAYAGNISVVDDKHDMKTVKESVFGSKGNVKTNDRHICQSIMSNAKSYETFEDFNKGAYNVYIRTENEILDNIHIKPFIYPLSEKDSGSYDLVAAGMDIFGYVGNVILEDTAGRKYVSVEVQYTLSEAYTQKVIDCDSVKFVKEITDLKLGNDIFCISVYTKPFHRMNNEESLLPRTDYLLGVKARHHNLASEQCFHYSMPNHAFSVPEYSLMFIREYEGTRDKEKIKPYWPIPFFSPLSVAKRGENLNVWIPVTDLQYSEKDGKYCGIVEIYLSRESSGKGKVTEEASIVLWNEEDQRRYMRSFDDFADTISSRQPKPIAVDTIFADQPNLLDYSLQLKIPARSEKKEYCLLAFLHSMPGSGERTRLLSCAAREIIIK